MTTQDKRTETILTYTSDVHALVVHGLQAIGQQVEQLKTVSHKDAEPAVLAFQQALTKQKDQLEARVTALGGKATTPVKDAVSGALGAVAGVINKTRSSATVKAIRDDYTFLSHLGVAYFMLHTTASSLGDTETASLAERGYADTARLVMHIDRIMPKMLVEELGEDKELHPTNTLNPSMEMLKKAWNREAPTGIGS